MAQQLQVSPDAILSGVPSAVLVVDLALGQVIHVNAVAQQLAPGVTMPVDVEDWSAAAALRDADGCPLSDSAHPLTRVARAQPVEGEAVSAARASEMGRRREPLWVVGVPMTGAPLAQELALVVMLPLRSRPAQDDVDDVAGHHTTEDVDRGRRTQLDLHSRAFLATGLSITVSDATAPDEPLIWVNPAFTRTTGYTQDDAIGRNCRFLQGRDTDPVARAEFRRAFDAGEATTVTLLNYRKDGHAFYNQVSISPMVDGAGTVTHYVGIQHDVTDRVAADRARDAALAGERRARAAAEEAEERLQLMVDASVVLSRTLDVKQSLRQLLDLVVPRIADTAVLLSWYDDEVKVMSRHADPAQAESYDAIAQDLPHALRDGDPVEILLGGRTSRVLHAVDTDAGSAARSDYLVDEAYLDRLRALDIGSGLYVALPGRDRTTDVLGLGRRTGRADFTASDVATIVDFGHRVGLSIENTRLFESQRHIAETLQRSLLPALPEIEGLEVAAAYHVGARGAEVGGDFYEVLDLEDAIGLAVGDVVGHDVLAAAAMGHLKGALRACAHFGDPSPAATLTQVDRLLQELREPSLATAVYARLRPVDDGWEITWSSAGHPPLVHLGPDGRARELVSERGNDTLLGLGVTDRHDSRAVLPVGSTLVGYTDGLVERRGDSIDAGITRLLTALEARDHDGPDDVVAHLLDTLGRSQGDDTAVVVLCLSDPGSTG